MKRIFGKIAISDFSAFDLAVTRHDAAAPKRKSAHAFCWQFCPRPPMSHAAPHDQLHRKKRARHAASEASYSFSRAGDLSSRFGELLFSEQHSDLTLIVGVGDAQQRIFAHRLVLSVAAQPFCKMLDASSSWRESSAATISLPDHPPAIIKQCLRYIYTAAVNLTPADAMGVLEAARRYQLDGLQDACRAAAMHFALSAVHVDRASPFGDGFFKCMDNLNREHQLMRATNIFTVFTSAVEMGDEPLKLLALPHVDKLATTLFGSADFLRTARYDHLLELLARDELCIREFALYESLVDWASLCHSRAEQLPILLPLIRLPLFKKTTLLHPNFRKRMHFSADRILDSLAFLEKDPRARLFHLVPSLSQTFETEKVCRDFRVTFGRHSAVGGVVIDLSCVSRVHCKVERVTKERKGRVIKDRVMVTNSSTTNGTYVGGILLNKAGEKRELKVGSMLEFSSTSKPGLPSYKLTLPQADPWFRPRGLNRSCDDEDDSSDSDSSSSSSDSSGSGSGSGSDSSSDDSEDSS